MLTFAPPLIVRRLVLCRSAKEYSVPIQSLREKMIHRLTLLKTVAVEYSVQVVNIVQEDTSASTSIDDSGSNDSGRNSSDGSGSSSNGRSGGSGGGDNSGGARGRRFSRKKRLVTAPTRRRRATGRARTNITIQKSERHEGLFSEEEEEKEEEELEEAAAAAAACSSNSNDRHGELDGSGDHSVTNRSQRGTASIFSTLVSAYTDTDADTSAIYFCECHDGSRRGACIPVRVRGVECTRPCTHTCICKYIYICIYMCVYLICMYDETICFKALAARVFLSGSRAC